MAAIFDPTIKCANVQIKQMFDKYNYPWVGNEEEFQHRIWQEGGRSFVIGNCWVFHEKIRGWK